MHQPQSKPRREKQRRQIIQYMLFPNNDVENDWQYLPNQYYVLILFGLKYSLSLIFASCLPNPTSQKNYWANSLSTNGVSLISCSRLQEPHGKVHRDRELQRYQQRRPCCASVSGLSARIDACERRDTTVPSETHLHMVISPPVRNFPDPPALDQAVVVHSQDNLTSMERPLVQWGDYTVRKWMKN